MNSLTLALERFALTRPRLLLVLLCLGCLGVGVFSLQARLDASGDSLLLESDPDLRYYRSVLARYGSDDYLVVTFSPKGELFSNGALSRLRSLRDQLRAVDVVASVTTILDVPLIASPPLTLAELEEGAPTLLSERTDPALARKELTQGKLYSELIMSPDGSTTALLVTLRRDERYQSLLTERDRLRVRQAEAELAPAEAARLDELNFLIREQREHVVAQQRIGIAEIRSILDRYRDQSTIRLGGLPMIVVDMLDYIIKDVMIFGTGILLFLVGLLSTIFVRPRWVVVAMLGCLLTASFVSGLLGILDWPITVVSANYVALLLIFSLSLTVHLIVRYQELHLEQPRAEQRWLVCHTLRDKFVPCLFTALTTMVAFASLLVSDIRPVIDFGWTMVIGMSVMMVVAFSLFPAVLMQLQPGTPLPQRRATAAVTAFFAGLVARWPRLTLVVYALIAVVSIGGLTQVQVENRFIDNFKEDTEIYQGLVAIDQKLGGTTPLDVILDADPEFFAETSEPAAVGSEPEQAPAAEFADDEDFASEFGDEPDDFDEDFSDEFGEEPADDFGGDDVDLGSSSYWYNSFRLEQVAEVHDYLESLPETGKVLSMATTLDVLRSVNGGKPIDTFFLSVLYKKLPEQVKSVLVDPYLSADGNQVRLSVRVFESDPGLRRDVLLKEIRTHLTGKLGLKPEQVRLSGMLVLYNNVLQSLYRSQILTIGFVFLAILLMFAMLFRSLKIALIGLAPNILAATVVLGVMGLFGIPLDIMTITIAAITVGIGVDDSIHYLHRFIAEFRDCSDYKLAVQRSHASIGCAMYYTSIVIAAGFSILVLSNFVPTIYFGLLTAFAMLFAMVANLTFLPLLLTAFRPLGPGHAEAPNSVASVA